MLCWDPCDVTHPFSRRSLVCSLLLTFICIPGISLHQATREKTKGINKLTYGPEVLAELEPLSSHVGDAGEPASLLPPRNLRAPLPPYRDKPCACRGRPGRTSWVSLWAAKGWGKMSKRVCVRVCARMCVCTETAGKSHLGRRSPGRGSAPGHCGSDPSERRGEGRAERCSFRHRQRVHGNVNQFRASVPNCSALLGVSDSPSRPSASPDIVAEMGFGY